jgi:hypothetical protein
MYVVIEILTCVGVISSTLDSTLSAGRNIDAPKGDIRAEMDTRKMIHVFMPLLKTE